MAGFAKRPDKGVTAGTPLPVHVNMFRVNGEPKGKIFQFDVEITEAGKEVKRIPQKGERIKNNFPAPLNRRILAEVVRRHQNDIFDNVPVAYDGNANLYTTRVIKFDNDAFEHSFADITVMDEESQHERTFNLTIKQAATLDLADLASYLAGRSTTIPQSVLTGLDVILMHLPAYSFITGRLHLFSPTDFMGIGGGVVAHNGFYTSVRPCKGGLFVNVDLACSSFYEPLPVLQALSQVCKLRGPEELAGFQMREFEMKKFKSFVFHLKVATSHRSDYRRILRVTGLGKPARDCSFKDQDGNVISVPAYFESTYGYRLRYPNLPVLLVGSKGAMMPMEVCTILPGQYYRHKLDPDQTAAMIKVSCNRPDVRQRKIMDGINEIQFQDAPQLADLGLSFRNEMTQVNGHCLEPPRLIYGRGKNIMPDSGAWNLRDLAFSAPSRFPAWGVLCLAGGRFIEKRKIEKFVTELVHMATKMGMGCEQRNPPILMINPRDRLDIPGFMNHLNNQVKQATKQDMGFVLCVMDDRDNIEAYKQIKCFTDSRVGIPSQCFLAKNLGRDRGPSPQYLGNILLKINAKLGGRNHDPERNLTKVFPEPTIVFGADVTHPGPGARTGNPSIVAIVASQDPYMSKYSAMLTVQGSNQEHIESLKSIVKEQLRRFYGANKQLKPSRIIFFRDGVSEGQFRQVFDLEVTAIRGACAEIEPDYRPTITFIVVQKRHHVRFFPPSGSRMTDRSGNVKAGTVIDTEIVNPTDFDFYLQSHAGIQGTSRPAHYYTLLDENGFNSNSLAEFINMSCYINARCTRAVSIPPAVYYAHLVAYRGRILTRFDWGSDSASVVSGQSEKDLLPLHQNFDFRLPMFYV